MAEVSRRDVYAVIAAQLGTVPHAVGYYGQVGRGLDGDLIPEPQPKSATDLRVEPYFILFPSPGGPGPDTDLGDCAVDGTFGFHVTVAGGDIEDVLALVTRVTAALRRWTPTVAGLVCGRVRHPEGYSPGPVLLDPQHAPARSYVPIPFQFTATAS